jgi:site-specific recombinase XerD
LASNPPLLSGPGSHGTPGQSLQPPLAATPAEASVERGTVQRNPGRPAGAATAVIAAGATIGRHHFGLLRALAEGLPAGPSWNRYLGFCGLPFDPRLHDARIERLCRQVADHARRVGPREAELARIALHRPRLLGAAPAGGLTEKATPPSAAGLDPSGRPALADEQPSSGGLPSLMEWVDEQIAALQLSNPDFEPEFYTEQEWRELYEEEFGVNAERKAQLALPATRLDAEQAPDEDDHPARPPTPTQTHAGPQTPQGHAPSRQEQIDALSELDVRIVASPRMADACTVWLAEPVCRRLARVGVLTLADFAAYVNLHGQRWFRHVEGVGATLARRLLLWLEPWAAACEAPLQRRALLPQALARLARTAALEKIEPDSMRIFGIVPLERLRVPPHLDGRTGQFRTLGPNVLDAQTDLQAVLGWLARYRESPRTLQSYQRTVECFYLFCVIQLGKPLSSVAETDLMAYRDFLRAPQAHWVQVGRPERDSTDWRPLKGPLSPSSQRHAFTVLASLFQGLMEAGYLRANPARGVVPKMKLPPSRIDTRRSFTEAQWSLLMRTVRSLPDGPGLRRSILVLELAATTGLRLIELVTARTSDLRQEWIEGQLVWMLEVKGKGNRRRRVMIFDDVKALIDRHHEDMRAAGTDFDPRARRIRTLLERPDAQSLDAIDADESGMRPLVGALRPPPARWRLDELGVPVLAHDAVALADRFGALDPTALYQSLKRMFRRAADVVRLRGDLVDQADAHALQQASTHWLRHFFANTLATDHVLPAAMQKLLGHADLKTTSIYINAEERLMVREMSKVRRR